MLSFGNTCSCISSLPLKTFFFFFIFSPFNLYPISAYVLVLFSDYQGNLFLHIMFYHSVLLALQWLSYRSRLPRNVYRCRKVIFKYIFVEAKHRIKVLSNRLLYTYQFPLQLGFHSLIRSLTLSDVNHVQAWCLKSSYKNPKLIDPFFGDSGSLGSKWHPKGRN